MDPNRTDETPTEEAAKGFALALNFIVSILLLGAIGWGIDWWQGTGPWGFLIGIGVGFGAGLYLMVKDAKRLTAGSGRPRSGS